MRAILLPLLLLSSCSLFGRQDVSPAVEAADAMLRSHWSTASGIKTLLDNPKVTIDPAVKTAIFSAVDQNLDRATRAHAALVAALGTWGDVDWQAIYERLKQAYEEMRSGR